MNNVLNTEAMQAKVGSYLTGSAADCVTDPDIIRQVRMRRRQLGRMMTAYDKQTAKQRLPAGDYHISLKLDGEFTCLVYRDGEVFTINPGGTVRAGAPFHAEAAKHLKKAGVKSALLGGELYVQRDDGKRPRVHDVVRVARAPENQAQVDSLAFGIFNIYDLDGDDLSMHYGNAIEKAQEIFGENGLVHAVDTVVGDEKLVFKQFNEWVEEKGEEGVVIRSDAIGVHKIKLRHTLDLAVVGFSEGIDDRSGLLHSMLMAVIRDDGTFQIIGRVGGGFTEEQRANLLKQLTPLIVESEYAEVNSDRVAYQMIRPGTIIEISCLDIISRTSHGSTIDRMILEWDEDKDCWEGLRRLPLCSIISPQFVRLREDKQATPDDVKMSQISDIADIPELQRVADDLILPTSTVISREVAVKTLKGAMMVRKLLLWKTNKEDVSRDHPAYVLHLTDFSPNRKAPLQHDIRVSSSETQIKSLLEEWRKKYFVRGWKAQE